MLLLLAACSSVPAALDAGRVLDADVLQTAYNASVEDAAVYEARHTRTLKTITSDSVTVLTWTNFPSSYTPGQSTEITWGEVWVTLLPEVKEACAQFPPGTLVLGLEQLLGLPPANQDRTFVEMRMLASVRWPTCSSPMTRAGGGVAAGPGTPNRTSRPYQNTIRVAAC